MVEIVRPSEETRKEIDHLDTAIERAASSLAIAKKPAIALEFAN